MNAAAASHTFGKGWTSGVDQGINAFECFNVVARDK